MPHPAVQIYLWISLTLLVQMQHGYALILLALVLIASASRIFPLRFYMLLRRTRWILFSMLLIYAYASPGAGVWPQLGVFSPVTDGVLQGFMQILRLLAVLAGLSILLSLLTPAQLITGLYTLSRPLCWLGLSRERVAVRLALCMRYAENAMRDTSNNWRASIENLLAPMPVEAGFIELHVAPFSRRDRMLVASASAALVGIWLLEKIGR